MNQIPFSARKSALLSLLLIALSCLLSYSNTFHVPFQLDDTMNISEKPYVKDITSFLDPVKIEHYRTDGPYRMRMVTYFTLAVNYWIHGNDVVGYHIVNIIIHIFNGFLVYFLVFLTLRTPYFALNRVSFPLVGNPSEERLRTSRSDKHGLIALFTALLFVSHPVMTQAITYIIQRTASLAVLFYLLSLVMYIKGRLASRQAGNLTGYILSLLSAILAMKTKEIAFTLPLVIALYEFLFFHGTLKKRILYLLPLLLTMLIIPLELMGLERPAGAVMGEMNSALRVLSDLSRWDYLLTQFRVIVTYIRLLFFPVNQNLDYDYPVYHSFSEPNVYLSFLFLFSIFCAAVYLLYKSSQQVTGNRLPEKKSTPLTTTSHLSPVVFFRLISFGIFWFFITLSVESSVIPITDVIFEHRVYLPSVGFFVAVTACAFVVWVRITKESIKKAPTHPPLRVRGGDKGEGELFGYGNAHTDDSGKNWPAKIAIALFGLIIVVLSGATYARNSLWKDEVKLWQDVVTKSPMKVRARSNLGHFYGKQGRFEEAVREYEIALRLDPGDFQVHNNLGVVFKAQGRLEEAIKAYRNAQRLNPDDALVYYNLGNIFREQGNFEEAVRNYQTAIRLEPEVEVAVIHNNLGIAYIGLGNKEAAAHEFRAALDIEPGYETARANLEMLLNEGAR